MATLLQMGARWLANLEPERIIKMTFGQPIVIDGKALDPQLHLLCFVGRRLPPLNSRTPQQARRQFDNSTHLMRADPPKVARIKDMEIRGPQGTIPLRILNPAPDEQGLPVLVYYHGGGFVIGGNTSHQDILAILATEAHCIVVGVDYHLAPEFPFPAAIQDGLAAYRWVQTHAAELGGDPGRVGVAGDSAGGNLSAVVSLMTREEHLPLPCLQALIYPATDLAEERPSYETFGEGFILDVHLIRWFKDNYVADAHTRLDWRASPLRAPDLTGLPVTYLSTAGFDPLSDEGEAYARRLEEAGVAVTYRNFPSLTHGYIGMTGLVKTAQDATLDLCRWLKDTFNQLPQTTWS